MVPGIVCEPPIVSCVAPEKFHSRYAAAGPEKPLMFGVVQEKLPPLPLVSTLMTNGMVAVGDVAEYQE